MSAQLGIDLGGTKIEGIVLDNQGKTLWQQRIKTPQGDYQATLTALINLIIQAETALQLTLPIGLGLPGSLSPTTGLMRNANSTCLNGQALKKDLESQLKRSINISNDANCFVLSEATDGAAKGAKSVFGVIIGTGTGAGMVFNGQLLNGQNGIAGEWGHNPLPWASAEENQQNLCWCGQKSCIETWLSGPALEKSYFKQSHLTKTATQIVKAAETGDIIAEQILIDYESRMARSLAHIINIFDPEIIVLGGGLSNISRLYQNIPPLWSKWVFSDQVTTQLVAPLYGDASGVRGACWLAGQS